MLIETLERINEPEFAEEWGEQLAEEPTVIEVVNTPIVRDASWLLETASDGVPIPRPGSDELVYDDEESFQEGLERYNDRVYDYLEDQIDPFNAIAEFFGIQGGTYSEVFGQANSGLIDGFRRPIVLPPPRQPLPPGLPPGPSCLNRPVSYFFGWRSVNIAQTIRGGNGGTITIYGSSGKMYRLFPPSSPDLDLFGNGDEDRIMERYFGSDLPECPAECRYGCLVHKVQPAVFDNRTSGFIQNVTIFYRTPFATYVLLTVSNRDVVYNPGLPYRGSGGSLDPEEPQNPNFPPFFGPDVYVASRRWEAFTPNPVFIFPEPFDPEPPPPPPRRREDDDMDCCSCSNIARMIRNNREQLKEELMAELNPDAEVNLKWSNFAGQSVSETLRDKRLPLILRTLVRMDDFANQRNVDRDIPRKRAINILGGNSWFSNNTDDVTPQVTFQPVNLVNQYRNSLQSGENSTSTNLPNYLAQLIAVAGGGDSNLTARIYNILGGDFWFTNQQSGNNPSLNFNPETFIETARNILYAENQAVGGQISVQNILFFASALLGVLYGKSGFHRYPATVPRDLTSENNENQTIYDAASWQEWLLLQLDALMGQYPIKIKYKDGQGDDKTLSFGNSSEILAEIMGMLLSINGDTDVIEAILARLIGETMGARTAAITASDYAKANAEFLGYRRKEKRRQVQFAFNPQARSTTEALQNAVKDLPQVVFDDSDDLQDFIKKILVGTEIVRAAFYRPFNGNNDELPGDRIKNDRSTGNDDDNEWNQFLQRVENPPAGERDPNAPTPNIRNIAEQQPPQ